MYDFSFCDLELVRYPPFLFINLPSRQSGHYGETWKHPIPFRPRYVKSSCAICTEIIRETWYKPAEKKWKILLFGSLGKGWMKRGRYVGGYTYKWRKKSGGLVFRIIFFHFFLFFVFLLDVFFLSFSMFSGVLLVTGLGSSGISFVGFCRWLGLLTLGSGIHLFYWRISVFAQFFHFLL